MPSHVTPWLTIHQGHPPKHQSLNSLSFIVNTEWTQLHSSSLLLFSHDASLPLLCHPPAPVLSETWLAAWGARHPTVHGDFSRCPLFSSPITFLFSLLYLHSFPLPLAYPLLLFINILFPRVLIKTKIKNQQNKQRNSNKETLFSAC